MLYAALPAAVWCARHVHRNTRIERRVHVFAAVAWKTVRVCVHKTVAQVERQQHVFMLRDIAHNRTVQLTVDEVGTHCTRVKLRSLLRARRGDVVLAVCRRSGKHFVRGKHRVCLVVR